MLWANLRLRRGAAEVSTVDEARAREAAFDRGAQAIVVEAGKERTRREGFRWVTVRGQRRAYRIFAEPVSEDEIAAFAMDITESEENREALRRHVAAHDETLNHLADAVAIFRASSRKLSFYNTASPAPVDLDAATRLPMSDQSARRTARPSAPTPAPAGDHRLFQVEGEGARLLRLDRGRARRHVEPAGRTHPARGAPAALRSAGF